MSVIIFKNNNNEHLLYLDCHGAQLEEASYS